MAKNKRKATEAEDKDRGGSKEEKQTNKKAKTTEDNDEKGSGSKKGKQAKTAEESCGKAKDVKTKGGASPADAILAKMMDLHLKRGKAATSFGAIMKAKKMNDHNTNWREAWKQLIDDGLILAETTGGMFTSEFRLTDKGLDHCMSPEQKELRNIMEKPAETNDEHQDRIKKVYCDGWNGRGVEIFGLLLKHGSCKRKEIAALMGISDRGASFNYSLKALHDHKFVEKDPNCKGNIRLSDEAFLSLDDRPDPVEMDPEALAAGMEKVYGKEMRKAQDKKGKKQAHKANKGSKDSKTGRKKEEGDPEVENAKETQEEASTMEAGNQEDEQVTNEGDNLNKTIKSHNGGKTSGNKHVKVANASKKAKTKTMKEDPDEESGAEDLGGDAMEEMPGDLTEV
jgi:hypothetical protein